MSIVALGTVMLSVADGMLMAMVVPGIVMVMVPMQTRPMATLFSE